MINIKTVQMIDVDDFNKLVRETYGKPYNFQQQNGCKMRGIEYITVPSSPDDFENDSISEKINGGAMGVSFKAWLARDVKQPVGKHKDQWLINIFWERNFYPDTQMILNDLHNRGLFPAGDYIVKIDW